MSSKDKPSLRQVSSKARLNEGQSKAHKQQSTESIVQEQTSSRSAKSGASSTNNPSNNGTRKNAKKPNSQVAADASVGQAPQFWSSDELTLQLEEDTDLNEMDTTKFPGEHESLLVCDENMVEQETDVDGDENNSLQRDNEKTGLLIVVEQESCANKAKTKSTTTTKGDLRSTLTNQCDKPESEVAAALPRGWEQHTDKEGLYYWHVPSGVIQRHRPTSELSPKKGSLVFYHDDEEINQAQKTSSDEDDYFESGAALTQADDTSESTFVVHLLGRCEFDETQLASNTSTKAIQKCILRLCNRPAKEETVCWGLDQSSPVLMRLYEDYIQFTDLKTRALLRRQPIQTIKTWAVDDDNNFAFVIEECAQQALAASNETSTSFLVDSVDNALLSEPILICYVFRSMDDDDMSCKVAAKLNEEIGRYKEQMSSRISRSTKVQQMVERRPSDEGTDADENFEDLEASNELTMNVKYIGTTSVPRPTGIDVLNAAIDKCLAEASKAHVEAQAKLCLEQDGLELKGVSSTSSSSSASSLLIEAKLHVSPSSVIVENVLTGEIIVECRIRYLTFIGISRRDIRWCGFIMQNGTSSKNFVTHSFECNPTAGHVCEAIQQSCNRMYEKVVKNNSRQPETMSIIPTSSKIRNTLAKTFSRIKLNPIS